MKKEILNEVNRAREIMGLAQLISEQLRVQTTLPNTAPGVISRFILKTGASLPESVKFLQNFVACIFFLASRLKYPGTRNFETP